MSAKTVQRTSRAATLTFMVVATALMLAFTLHQAARGAPGIPGMVVYAFCTGFGLEYLCSTWRGALARTPRRRLTR